MQIRRRAVFLVGYMGAGKTSVGRYVAQRLRWNFVDLDDRIEAFAGRSVAEIFDAEGEIGFRGRESTALAQVLGELAEGAPTIVALGGGAYAQTGNVTLLTGFGAPVIFLDAPVEELWNRTQQAGSARPLRSDEHAFRTRHEERWPQYSQAAHRIDTAGKSVAEVAAEVVWLISMSNIGSTEDS